MLNILEYPCIYLNKQSSEYTRILNISDAGHSIRSLYKLMSSHRDSTISSIQNIIKQLRWSLLQKRMPKSRRTTRNFSGQGRFRETRALR